MYGHDYKKHGYYDNLKNEQYRYQQSKEDKSNIAEVFMKLAAGNSKYNFSGCYPVPSQRCEWNR